MKSQVTSTRLFGKKVSLRIPLDMKKKLDSISQALHCRLSDLYTFAMKSFLEKYAVKTDKKTVELIKEFNRKNSLMVLRKIHKEKRYCRYLIKNTQHTLFEQQRSFFFNSGKLNMNLVSKTIEEAKAEFRCFPMEIKEELKDEIGNLENFMNEDFLIGRMGMFRQIERKKKGK